jgi:hypothetical protein
MGEVVKKEWVAAIAMLCILSGEARSGIEEYENVCLR